MALNFENHEGELKKTMNKKTTNTEPASLIWPITILALMITSTIIAAKFGVALIMITGIIAGTIYFLPTLVAYRDNKKNKFAIGVLNLLLGLSGIGWIIAMVWACTKD